MVNGDMKLLPCPACGNRAAVWIYDNQITYAAKCDSCGMSGPQTFIREVELSEMIDKAAEVWNALPRALVWRKDIPDVNFYSNHDDIFFAEIEGKAVIIYASEMADTLEQPGLVNRWAGPIPMPKEPTE